jgi:hypothetical protein
MADMQRQCLRIPIRDGHLDGVTSWIRSLAARHDEVAAAVTSEGITTECVMLDVQGPRPCVLLYTAGPDLQHASAAFAASTLAVDVEFKSLMARSLDLAGASVVEVLFGWP